MHQDFELWSRLLPEHKGANLPAALVRYRVHQDSMTQRHTETFLRLTLEIIVRRLQHEGP